jgi:hypothetical protein
MRRLAVRGTMLLGMLGAAACGNAPTAETQQPPAGVTSVVLRAWEDTRRGLPPLAVTRADSVTMFLEFIAARSNGWQNAGASLPGTPLYAELRRGTRVAGRFGFIEISHGAGGYFIRDGSTPAQLRTATAAELAQFLAFFGISVEIRPDP